MKRLILILISICLLVIDNTILPYYSINGVFPSLLFVFAIAYSIICGSEEAIFIGIVSGLLQDIFFFKGFGKNLFLCLLLAFCHALCGSLYLLLSTSFFHCECKSSRRKHWGYARCLCWNGKRRKCHNTRQHICS